MNMQVRAKGNFCNIWSRIEPGLSEFVILKSEETENMNSLTD